MKKFVFLMAFGLSYCALAAVPAHAEVTGLITKNELNYTRDYVNDPYPYAIHVTATVRFTVTTTETTPSYVNINDRLYIPIPGNPYYLYSGDRTMSGPVTATAGQAFTQPYAVLPEPSGSGRSGYTYNNDVVLTSVRNGGATIQTLATDYTTSNF